MLDRATTDIGYDRVAMLTDTDAELDRIRAHGDVVWSTQLRRWMVTSHAAVDQALRDPRLHVFDLFQSFEKIEAKTNVDLGHMVRICDWIPFLHDGSKHTATRALFARILADLKHDYLREYTRTSKRLLNALIAHGGGDFARDYADLLHAETIGALAGLEQTDSIWIARNSSSQGSIDFAASVSEMADASTRAARMIDRLETLIDQPDARAFVDRIGAQLAIVGLPDTRQNRIECLLALFMLGRDTLGGTLTLGLTYLLDQHDGQLTAGAWGDPDAITDEVIRLSSTVQISLRVAQQDLDLAGQQIAKGDALLIFLPAANHDPAVYACPHAVATGQSAHLAFGAGRHLCTGMPLARSAMTISLSHLAQIGKICSLPGRDMEQSRNTRKLKTFPMEIHWDSRL